MNLPLQPAHLGWKLAAPHLSGTGDFDMGLPCFDALVHEDPRLSKSAKLMELLSILEANNAKTQVEDATTGRFSRVYHDSARLLLIQYYGGVHRIKQRYKLKFEEVKPLKLFNTHDIRAIHSRFKGICQASDANCEWEFILGECFKTKTPLENRMMHFRSASEFEFSNVEINNEKK